MDNNTFELFLKTCGTEESAATLLGITQPHISQIRSGYRSINYEKSILISNYLKEKLNLNINPIELVSDNKKNKLKLAQRSIFSSIPISYGKIDLRILEINKNYHQDKNYKNNSIIIDEFNYLISGEETYYNYISVDKKITDGYKFPLQKLVSLSSNKSIIAYIYEEFDLIERTKLAQRVENLSGNRRGKPSKKCANVENSPHLVLPEGIKTRELVAMLFSLGSDHTYRTLKKITAHNDQALIEQVRREAITPHAAYQQILRTQPKSSFSFRSLFRR